MALTNRISFNNVQGDVFGGVTAAVIALPMALAFGVASGAGPEAGLYGAVLIGFLRPYLGAPPP
jgi:SulP family sulfate permease